MQSRKFGNLESWKCGVLMLVLALVALSGVGCTDAQIEAYQATRAELVAALELTEAKLADAESLIAELNAQIDAMQDGPEKAEAVEARDKVASIIVQAKAAIPQLEEGITRTTAAIDAALAGNAAHAVQIMGPYIASKTPPPWNVYILGGSTVLGFVLSYIQKRKKDEAEAESKKKSEEIAYQNLRVDGAREYAEKTRKAAADVITAIEYEKGDNDTVNFGDPNTKISLRSSMSTEARELVEQVRRSIPPRVATLSTIKDTTAPGHPA
jgi:hypothetical protein